MTAEQLSRLRTIVETEIGQIHQAVAAWRDCNGPDENGVQRIHEHAARMSSQEWKYGMDRRLQELLRMLCRMEHDDFGVCEECGEDISVRRLEILPTTSFCSACMGRREVAQAV